MAAVTSIERARRGLPRLTLFLAAHASVSLWVLARQLLGERRPLGAGLVALFSVAALAALVAWALWFRPLYDVAIATGHARYRRGWAVAAWVVPFVTAVVPKQLVNDVWRTGGPGRPPLVVQAWWAATLVVLGAGVAGTLVPGGTAVEDVLRPLVPLATLLTAPFGVATAYALTRRLERRVVPATGPDVDRHAVLVAVRRSAALLRGARRAPLVSAALLLSVPLAPRVLLTAERSDGLPDAIPAIVVVWALVVCLSVLVAQVVWLRWFAAVHAVARATGHARYGTFWWVWWFVPVASWWIPKQQVNDVWRAGGPGAPPAGVQAWWALWVVALASPALREVTDVDLPWWLTVVPLAGALLLSPRVARLLTERVRRAADAPGGPPAAARAGQSAGV